MGIEQLFCLVWWKDCFFDSYTVVVVTLLVVYLCLALLWPWWRMEIRLSTLKLWCWVSEVSSSSSTCEERDFFLATDDICRFGWFGLRFSLSLLPPPKLFLLLGLRPP